MANRTYRILHRKWPQAARRSVWYLMGIELAGLIPLLVIFGIAQPDLYRTKMWQIGYDNGLNSNPNMILYAYANHRPLPDVPLIWSRTLTDFNVAISIISLFFLLTRLISFIMKLWYPIIATFVNAALLALYSASIYGQIGPDYADRDPRRHTAAAWYFKQGCDLARRYGAYKSCQIAQASLGVTFYMFTIYLVGLGFSIYAMLPNKRNDSSDEDDDDNLSTGSGDPKHNMEMQGLASPREMPFTPRTQAFHTLDRKVPQQTATQYR